MLKSLKVLILAASIFISILNPALAMSDAEEAASVAKLEYFIYKSINPAIREATMHGQHQRALDLNERVVALWENEKYQSTAAKLAQARACANAIQLKADLLQPLGRHDEAAQLLIKCDAIETEQIRKANPASLNASPVTSADTDRALQLAQIGSVNRYKMASLPYGHPYLMAAGQTYVEGKMYDRAETLFKNFCADYPAAITLPAHVRLSQIYLAQGNNAKAESELKNLLTEQPFVNSVMLLRSVRIELKSLYLKEKKTVEADKIEVLLQDQHCPTCHSSEHVFRIAYGLRCGTPARSVFGGCVTNVYSPRWQCQKDGTSF